MSFFILIVTFWVNGQNGASVTKFDTQRECMLAMQAVHQNAPNLTAICKPIRAGN